ncbi:MAG: hypothetical protein II244_05965 [Clostridia bacterium]|nr:hypothetical protein [Clostridia bacterium]
MITTILTKLTANAGMVLTNGKDFTHSVLLREGESPEDWSEITEDYYHKLMAQMTPREFILKLMEKGITRTQLETLINSSERVWAELNYATLITRANPLLDELCGQFGLTPADVDEMFGL